MVKSARKSASRGLFLLPDVDTIQTPPKATYWMDSEGKVWYSGPKSKGKPDANRGQVENVPPAGTKTKTANKRLDFCDSTSVSTSKKARIEEIDQNEPVLEVQVWNGNVGGNRNDCTGSVLANGTASSPLTAKISKLSKQHTKSSELAQSSSRYWTNSDTNDSVVYLVGFFVAILALEPTADPVPAASVIRNPTVQFTSTTVDNNQRTFTVTLDLSSVWKTAKLPVPAVCASVRSLDQSETQASIGGDTAAGSGSKRVVRVPVYDSGCIRLQAGSNTHTPLTSRQATFTIQGFTESGSYSLTAVAWDEYGRKIMSSVTFDMTLSEGINRDSGLTAGTTHALSITGSFVTA